MRAKLTGWTSRFFHSTRGQIVMLLRQQTRTVADLAEALGLTDNAVRAHLATLERDALVHRTGERPGFRKPHYSYALTTEAEELFPKTYGPLLDRILTTLKERFGSAQVTAVLRDVGRDIAASRKVLGDAAPTARLEEVLKLLHEFGGQARIERSDSMILIRGMTCPLAAVTGDHTEVCKMIETIISKILGVPVRQKCHRETVPQCCFEVRGFDGSAAGRDAKLRGERLNRTGRS
jgi:predicted ArsR family transcriptional regulator